MPNTKSAERRVRSTARRQAQNKSIKNRLHTLEKKFSVAAGAGNKDEASTALKSLISAFDKAAKTGVVKKGTADRKKSRLTIQFNRATVPAPAKA
ncbi:MAG: 30S ribosomal protein S20 [Verrucomicrobia bacterium]|nr:30S ribosomal protein S20 [Verrucomicrobiota bacterium]